eukprot:TRINITY_DN32383_c0_g1_i1.p1 TRINITY_DN32383_c0_g1~~TRINITY_DN32383_c0_g1_i1.p1  ORF type:complete len:1256 (+),score=212.77 TRINITY_DN32383_c0_g1_i1:97-3864(+)
MVHDEDTDGGLPPAIGSVHTAPLDGEVVNDNVKAAKRKKRMKKGDGAESSGSRGAKRRRSRTGSKGTGEGDAAADADLQPGTVSSSPSQTEMPEVQQESAELVPLKPKQSIKKSSARCKSPYSVTMTSTSKIPSTNVYSTKALGGETPPSPGGRSPRLMSPLGLSSECQSLFPRTLPRTAGAWNRSAAFILNSTFRQLEHDWLEAADTAASDATITDRNGVQISREALLKKDVSYAGFHLDERTIDSMDKQSGNTGMLSLFDLVKQLFPSAARWEQKRFFVTEIPFDMLLVLRGSIGHGRGCTRYLPRTDRSFFGTYESITRNSAGRLSLEQLINAGEMIGSMHFPVQAFAETAERYSIDPEEYRATFWEILTTLFPKVSQAVLDRYAATFIEEGDMDAFAKPFNGQYFLDIAQFKKGLKADNQTRYQFSNDLGIDVSSLRFLDRDKDGKVSLYELIQAFYPNVAPPYIKRAINRYNHSMKHQQLQEYEEMMKCHMRLPVRQLLRHDGKQIAEESKAKAKARKRRSRGASVPLTEDALQALEGATDTGAPFDESDGETCKTLSTTSDRSVEREDECFEEAKNRLPTLRVLEVLKGIHKDFSPLTEIERRKLELDTMREVPYKVFLAQQNVKDVTAAVQERLLKEKMEKKLTERAQRRRVKEEAHAQQDSGPDAGLGDSARIEEEEESKTIGDEDSLNQAIETHALEIWRRQSDYVEVVMSDSDDEGECDPEGSTSTPSQQLETDRRATNYAVLFDATLSAPLPTQLVKKKKPKPWRIPREYYTQPDVVVVNGDDSTPPVHAAQIRAGMVCGIDHRKQEEQSQWYRNGTHQKPELRRSDRRAMRIGGTNMTSTKTNKVSELLNYENYDIFLSANTLSGDATNSPNVLTILEEGQKKGLRKGNSPTAANKYPMGYGVEYGLGTGTPPSDGNGTPRREQKMKNDGHASVYGSALLKIQPQKTRGRLPARVKDPDAGRSKTVGHARNVRGKLAPELPLLEFEEGGAVGRGRRASLSPHGDALGEGKGSPGRRVTLHMPEIDAAGVGHWSPGRSAKAGGSPSADIATPPFTPAKIGATGAGKRGSRRSLLELPERKRTGSQLHQGRASAHSVTRPPSPKKKPIPPQLEPYDRNAPRPREMQKVMSVRKRKDPPPTHVEYPSQQRARGGARVPDRTGIPTNIPPHPNEAPPTNPKRPHRPKPTPRPPPSPTQKAPGGNRVRRFRTSYKAGENILEKWEPPAPPKSPAQNYIGEDEDFPPGR